MPIKKEKVWNYIETKNSDLVADIFYEDYVDKNVFNIFNSTKNKERVLCVGEVQSGKTKNIIASIKHSYYCGYGSVVFLGGTNNCLNHQSYSRFIKELESWKVSGRKIQVVSDFSNVGNELIRSMNNDDFIVFIILKGKNKLSQLEKYFLTILKFFNKKTLLIDDESDYGSAYVDNPNANKIHNLVEKIYNVMHSGKFLSVTATPFANVLQCKQKFSITYDRFVFLERTNEYTGCDFFIKQKNFYISSDWRKNEWQDLIDESLSLWVISTAIYRKNEEKNLKSEFLINVDLLTPTHEKIKDFISKKLKWMHDYPDNKHWKKALFKNYPDESMEKEKIFNIAATVVDDVLLNIEEKIVLLNGSNKQSKDFYSGRFNNCVIIGGHVISRGFTFNNLITELFLNSPKQIAVADTTLQRCRWFGYRKKNNQYKYMRVFISNINLKTITQSNELIENIRKNKNMTFTELLALVEKYSHLKEFKLTGKK